MRSGRLHGYEYHRGGDDVIDRAGDDIDLG
jgi:hypothetical protein